MVRVLILTESVENELSMYEKLRHLNNEVFISQELVLYWSKFKTFPKWVSGFPLVIISETIYKEKMVKISEYVNKNNHMCLLKVDKQVPVEEQRQLEKIGIFSCIHTEDRLSNLRDNLIFAERKSNQMREKVKVLDDKSTVPFLKKLPPISTRIFFTLQQMNGDNISREQLSKKIWGKCNNATLSQLSLSVKKINNQIYQNLGITHGIITDWGKGYRLSEELCMDDQIMLYMN